MILCQNNLWMLFCCHSSVETTSCWDTDTAIMLIHAFVASKINNRIFCFLNGLELPAVCYLQLALSKAVPDITCSQKQQGISLFLKLWVLTGLSHNKMKLTILSLSFVPKEWWERTSESSGMKSKTKILKGYVFQMCTSNWKSVLYSFKSSIFQTSPLV